MVVVLVVVVHGGRGLVGRYVLVVVYEDGKVGWLAWCKWARKKLKRLDFSLQI